MTTGTEPRPVSDVDALEGRALDHAVALEVMGWEYREHFSIIDDEPLGSLLYDAAGTCRGDSGAGWKPSRSIAHAWEVVEALRERFGSVEVTYGWRWSERDTDEEWAAGFLGGDSALEETVSGFGDTAPLAICRAALRAVRAARKDTEGDEA